METEISILKVLFILYVFFNFLKVPQTFRSQSQNIHHKVLEQCKYLPDIIILDTSKCHLPQLLSDPCTFEN